MAKILDFNRCSLVKSLAISLNLSRSVLRWILAPLRHPPTMLPRIWTLRLLHQPPSSRRTVTRRLARSTIEWEQTAQIKHSQICSRLISNTLNSNKDKVIYLRLIRVSREVSNLITINRGHLTNLRAAITRLISHRLAPVSRLSLERHSRQIIQTDSTSRR